MVVHATAARNVHSYHKVGGPKAHLLAKSICRNLTHVNGELELVQALDEGGLPHLLVYTTSDEERRRMNLKKRFEISNPERDYHVLSPVIFRGHEVEKDLNKTIRNLKKEGVIRGMSNQKWEKEGFFSCLYEYSRLYERIVLDGMNYTKFKIPASSILFSEICGALLYAMGR
ncbi:hypothetical protein L218DRAFT_642845 [Marasmius fiardii PR-910]|nr:hypothetical protein L218DRAFT_642845 [Marasmius fiardii PR-910]